jgi:hypothetical protein
MAAAVRSGRVCLQIVPTAIRMPGMNSISKRWLQTCRCELLNQTLV